MTNLIHAETLMNLKNMLSKGSQEHKATCSVISFTRHFRKNKTIVKEIISHGYKGQGVRGNNWLQRAHTKSHSGVTKILCVADYVGYTNVYTYI